MEEKGKGIKTEGNTEARRRVPGGWRPVDGGSCMMDWKSRGQELRRLFSASWLTYQKQGFTEIETVTERERERNRDKNRRRKRQNRETEGEKDRQRDCFVNA